MTYEVRHMSQFSGQTDRIKIFEVEVEAIDYAKNIILTDIEGVVVRACEGWNTKKILIREGWKEQGLKKKPNLSKRLFV